MNALKQVVLGLNKVSKTVAKNSPVLLTVGGVVGLGATAYFSYKSAKKVETIVENIEDKRAHEIEVDRLEVVKDIAGAVALPVVVGIASVTCIALSYRIQNNRIVSLGAALATATAEQVYFERKFRRDYGEDEYRKFRTPVSRQMVKGVNEDGEEVEEEVVTKDEQASLTGIWFDKSSEYTRDDHDYNQEFIRQAEDKLQRKLFMKGTMLMNEMNDILGLPRTKFGGVMGWTAGSGFGLHRTVTVIKDPKTGEMRPEIYIQWTRPKNVFDTVEYE